MELELSLEVTGVGRDATLLLSLGHAIFFVVALIIGGGCLRTSLVWSSTMLFVRIKSHYQWWLSSD